MIDELQAAYLAGIIDGEGCIHVVIMIASSISGLNRPERGI